MSWGSQPSEDVKRGLDIPSVVFGAQQIRAQNQASLARSMSNGSNALVSQGPVEIRPSFGHGGGGGSIDIMAAVRLMELERQQQQRIQLQQERPKTSETSMNVYQDQLPAFIARLKELGLSGPGGTDIGFVPQARTARSDTTSEVSSDWFGTRYSGFGALGRSGSPISGLAAGSGASTQTSGSNYNLSPIEQQQQGTWQFQLPGIDEAAEKRMGGGKEQVFELSGDSFGRKRDANQGLELSSSRMEVKTNSRAGGAQAAPRWKDPLAWAREQRLKST